MNEIIEQIGKVGIVPVVVIEDVKDAAPLAEALCQGGICCAEVTFRTKAAAEAIQRMKQACPDMLIGAGTVLKTEQVDRAMDAGAQFIVSPGINPSVVSYCVQKGIVMIPGTANPSDIEIALELGLDVVKFFPAEALGGLKMIKAMSAPYGDVRFMPTGGIDMDNVKKYLAFEKILACGGSFMVKQDLIQTGDFARITQLTKEAAAVVKEVRGA